jgi:hypothetical protein
MQGKYFLIVQCDIYIYISILQLGVSFAAVPSINEQ